MRKETRIATEEIPVFCMRSGEEIPVGCGYIVLTGEDKVYVFTVEAFNALGEDGNLYQCRECGEWYFTGFVELENEEIEDGDRKPYDKVYDDCCDFLGTVCEDCISDNYTFCNGCDEYHRNSDMYEIRGLGDRCEHCRDNIGSVHRCDDCGTYFDCTGIEAYEHGNDTVCARCYDRHYVACCRECGNAIPESDNYLEDGCEYYCEACRRRIDDDNIPEECEAADGTLPIHSYSYKPYPVFGCTSAENEAIKLYMGFELEMGKATTLGLAEARGYLAGAGFGDESLIYLKSDGSIPDYGFEMVSHPMTLARHKEICSVMEPAFKKLVGYGLRSHNTGNEGCGLHVHVSRCFFHSERRMAFLDYFLNYYQDKVIKIARRKSSWARFHSGPHIAKKCGKTEEGHYDAVNFLNEKTVEIRVFRGTLKYETFLATLEFVDAVCRFVNDEFTVHSMLKREAWKCFIEYVQKHKDNYEELLRYLYEKNLIE